MKNRTLGSVFIVAGTTIGAGMLAMPLAAAGVGFSVTLILLIGLWALMCYTALLLLEVYQHVPADTGLGTLAKRYLGRYGQWLTGFSMMFLMYALTAAYISGAGELLASSISDWTGISMSATAGVLLFTFVAGGVVCVGTSLVQALREMVASPHVELAVHLFADLALATSFLGVALGLFDYLADLFQRSNTVGGRLQTGAITFLPPLAFALFYPRGFVMALGYAGVALAVLALIIPSLLTWQSRKHNPQAGYRVKGGRPALVVVFLCGIAVIGVQFLIAAGLLPEVG